MIKAIVGAILIAATLVACGGGGDGGAPTQPAAKALTISMYGKPLVSAPTKVARAQFSLISNAVADEAPGASDVQATVQSLQDALAARGVTASVTPQVMNGTSLHELVTTQYAGKSPDPSDFKDPSEYLIVNFQLDDMATPSTDPAQEAAIEQFSDDLLIFSQWAAVAGKAVFVAMPIQTCDTRYSASYGLYTAITSAAFNKGAPIRFIGSVPTGFGFDSAGKAFPIAGTDLSHYGADCRTPDAYLQNAYVNSIADNIAAIYKEAGGIPASDAGAASAPAASGA